LTSGLCLQATASRDLDRETHRQRADLEGALTGLEAVETARGADLVIAVMGELANMSGEDASRASLDLPGRQEDLLKALVALGKPVVLVLVNGRPLSINWAAQNVPAVLEAWQPGTEGGNAVADVLFGDANPGGKLPVTFPRSGAHGPLYFARNLTHQPEGSPRYKSRYWDGPTTPLYPFGYGLSYTTFAFSNLEVTAGPVKVGATARVRPEARSRAIAGLSMGGGQTQRVLAAQPGAFAYVAIWSAGVRPEGTEAFEKDAAPFLAAADKVNASIRLLSIRVGEEDFALPGSRNLSEVLTKHNIEHTLQVNGGGHTWINWRLYLRELLPLLFR
jgi:hypothetical protein